MPAPINRLDMFMGAGVFLRSFYTVEQTHICVGFLKVSYQRKKMESEGNDEKN